MTGAIPKYGEHFRRESVPFDPDRDLATRRYVLKADPHWFIQSSRDSEHWVIYIAGPAGAAFPLGGSDDTMTAAMRRCVAAHRAVTCDESPREQLARAWAERRAEVLAREPAGNKPPLSGVHSTE